MVAGSLTYDTKMDTSGFQKGINNITNSTKKGGNTIKNIVAGLGITKLISTALSQIKDSIDGAVKRVDTLNNFPKVMQNLGISSDESRKAIEKISKKLQGLPTTLDDSALAVQRFTSANDDVEKSTDYFLALNDALIAGGTSTDIQKSALEQLSQAYSKGKPDMMEWRTLMTAMPAQLKQVAKAMGYVNTDELYEEIKDGKISMDDFMEAIVRLDTEGTNGFLSFEQQARNATGGIQTSITNAKTAVTRGVAKIVDEIDKSLKREGFGGLSKVISDFGKLAENVLTNIGKFASGFIGVLKDIYDWFSKNQVVAATLAGIITGVVAAFVAYKTTLLIINGINFVSHITGIITAFIQLIPSIKSARDALDLLGMVTKKNPFAVLVAAIAAVVSAVAVFISATQRVDEKLKQTKEAAEEQRKSWNDLKEARNNALSTAEGEIAVIKKLKDELEQITDENGKVKEGYENRAKYILGELNKAMGTEYELNNNIIGEYQELKTNVDKLIQSKRLEATLDAYKEEYTEAIKKQSEATKTLVDLRKKLIEAENTPTKTVAEEKAKEQAIKGLNEAIKSQTDLIGEYGYTIEKYEKLTAASVSDSAEEVDGALKDIGISYEEAKTKTKNSLKQQINYQGDYVKNVKKAWEEAKNSNDKYQQQILETQLKTHQEELNNLADALAEQTQTVEKLSIDEIQAWKELATQSKDAYTRAINKVDETTAKEIQQATGVVVRDTSLKNATGQEGADAAKAYDKRFDLNKPTKEELSKAKDAIKNNTSIQNASERLGQKADKSFKGSYKIASEVKPILNDTANTLKYNTNVPDASWNLGNSINRKFWEIVKPYSWGRDIPIEISSGMMDAQEYIKQSVDKVARFIRDPLHFSEPDVGPLSDFHTYMPDMIDLMVKGINDNKYKVSNAIYGLTSDMEQEMKKAVNVEVGNMNATTTVRSNSMYNSVINLNASFDGTVEMDGQTAGRILTPYVTRTIKAGGAY